MATPQQPYRPAPSPYPGHSYPELPPQGVIGPPPRKRSHVGLVLLIILGAVVVTVLGVAAIRVLASSATGPTGSRVTQQQDLSGDFSTWVKGRQGGQAPAWLTSVISIHPNVAGYDLVITTRMHAGSADQVDIGAVCNLGTSYATQRHGGNGDVEVLDEAGDVLATSQSGGSCKVRG